MNWDSLGPCAVPVALGVVVFFLWRAMPEQRARRALRAIRPTVPDAVEDGARVKLLGRAAPIGPALRSPIFGTDCVFYEVWVRRRGPLGWKTLHRGGPTGAFALQVTDRLVRVDASDARVATAWSMPVYASALEELAGVDAGALLSRLGVEAAGISLDAIQLWERVVRADAAVAVLGRARRQDETLVIEAAPGAPVCVSDDPRTLS